MGNPLEHIAIYIQAITDWIWENGQKQCVVEIIFQAYGFKTFNVAVYGGDTEQIKVIYMGG